MTSTMDCLVENALSQMPDTERAMIQSVAPQLMRLAGMENKTENEVQTKR